MCNGMHARTTHATRCEMLEVLETMAMLFVLRLLYLPRCNALQ